MKVVVFGVLTDVIGNSVFEMEAPSDSDTLIQILGNSYPFLQNYRFEIAINKQKINSNITLNEMDEVALLPPYSGG